MRAIFINAEKKQITEIQLDPADTLAGMQKCVGGLIEVASSDIKTNDDLFVNEESAINGTKFGFTFGKVPFLGNGIICGHDPKTGDTVEAKTGLIRAATLVEFGCFGSGDALQEAVLDFASNLLKDCKKNK